MIHTFSVSNYGSIREEVTLDLRIPGTAPDLACFRPSSAKRGLRLPAVAVLMGPNGSGKTTLLRALVEPGRIVSSPADSALVLFPFLSNQTLCEPTRFCVEGEADFLAPTETPQRFRYELTIGRRPTDDGTQLDHFVAHEALVHFPKGRRRRLLERQNPEGTIYVSRDLGLNARDGRLKAIGPHRSAIATLALLNVPLATRFVDWWRKRVWGTTNTVGKDTMVLEPSNVVGWLETGRENRDWIHKQIQRGDLGIKGMEIVDGPDGKQLQFNHSGLDAPVPLRLESKGTRQLLHHLPHVKWALDLGGLAVLDEVDGALHVDMLWEIINQFRSRESNPRGAQLLISSHHVGVLDDLEKEEVFIVEKDDGATRVYGAQDVQGLRRDVRLYPKYRSGVLGGLPKFG